MKNKNNDKGESEEAKSRVKLKPDSDIDHVFDLVKRSYESTF